MSMPKGFKSENGYATVVKNGGMSYKDIAEKMTKKGYKIKHSAARNVLLSAMQKIATEVCSLYGLDEENVSKVASDPRFQSCVSEYLEEGIDI